MGKESNLSRIHAALGTIWLPHRHLSCVAHALTLAAVFFDIPALSIR